MEQGFTLTEFMVSLGIGMAVVAVLCGLVQVFWRMQSQTAHRSHGWRQCVTAGQQIVRAVHEAGFAGCVRPAGWGSPLQLNAARNEFTVLHASRQNATLIRSQNNPQALLVSRELIFQAGDNLLINNCLCIEQFTVQQVTVARENMQKIVPDHPLKCLPAEAEVYRVERERFFVGRDKVTGINVLYLQETWHQPRVLADNISRFRIEDDRRGGFFRGITACISSDVAGWPKKWCIFASPRNL